MRMRRKKNLEARIADCADYLIDCENEDLNFQNAEKEKRLIDYAQIFKNDNPVVLEIGCGKGAFACAFAEQNPEKNIIAIEKEANVIAAACEEAMRREIKNIKNIQEMNKFFSILFSK